MLVLTISTESFSDALLRLLTTARAELDAHVNEHGRCRACQMSFPCERACLADLALAAF
jgi:hypothetical protein